MLLNFLYFIKFVNAEMYVFLVWGERRVLTKLEYAFHYELLRIATNNMPYVLQVSCFQFMFYYKALLFIQSILVI